MLGLSLVVSSLLLVSTLAEVYFKEEFSKSDWDKRWVQSEHPGKEFGKFAWTAGKFYGDADADKGIQTSEDARFYGLSAAFPKFTNKDKPLVIQFSVKHEQNIDCGGGYVKVFPSTMDQKDMHGESPYNIMFGPDICGPGTKKVHVILTYKGKNYLTKKNIRCKDDEYTHVYTLILNPDNSYVVKIDNKEEEKGTIEEDWDMLPSKTIKDPDAKKPSQDEWDERETVPDVEDKKPEDWDKPQHVADPEAKKPEDWDDEMDGAWEPAQIENPDYKGEWKAREIPNPAYKGTWVHPEVANPEYSAEPTLYKFDDLGIIGFDLWQVKSGTIFDNVFITDDIKAAEDFANDTWGKNHEAEKKMKEKLDEEEKKKTDSDSKKDEEFNAETKTEDDDNEADHDEL